MADPDLPPKIGASQPAASRSGGAPPAHGATPAGRGAALALIAFGSNLAGARGDPAEQVRSAMEAVAALGEGGGASPSRLWRSPAWPPGGPPYVNAAMAIRTGLPPDDLLAALHRIEAAFGRERGARWAARTLDLDLLAVGDLVRPDATTYARWRTLDPGRQGREAPGGLVLPHPRMQDRAFVLLPLREVASGWRHPVLGLDAGGMAALLPPGAAEGVAPLDGPPGPPTGGPAAGPPLAKAPPTH